jgi:Development and cell death domain
VVNRRNLGEDSKLGGVVFGCTHETMDECLRNMIFGLPKSHWAYVYYIEPGLPIFLFNYHDRNLHGIFRAVSYGQLEINPHGAPMPRMRASCFVIWREHDVECWQCHSSHPFTYAAWTNSEHIKTRYPAQVEVEVGPCAA